MSAANELRLSTLTYLGFEVNTAIAQGHGNDITFDELYESLENGTILEDLDKMIPNEFDFSLFPTGSAQSAGLNEALYQVAEGLRGRERRKVGIEESGLHLLLAVILEAIQQGDWPPSNARQKA